MRYAGGGVGHYQIELNDSHGSESESTVNIANDEESFDQAMSETPLSDIQQDEDMTLDNSTNSDLDSELGDGYRVAEDDDLAEDGEGGFIDAEDEKGYAEL